MEIEHTNAATFRNQVLESTLPVLVEFTAPWCGPCKMLDPIVLQLAQEWGGKLQVLKLDIDENPEIPMQFQVMSIPTLLLFVAGKPVQRVTGFQPKNRLVAKFSSYI